MISDLFDSVVHVFARYKCPAVLYLGQQFTPQHTETLRVVMYQGEKSPADEFAPQNSASLLPSQTLQYINPRPVATRRAGFSVELWATAPKQRQAQHQFRADLAYLDALLNQFIVALQQTASGVFVAKSGVAAPGNQDANVAGLGYTLQCSCDVPVIDAPWPAQQLSECSKTWAYGPARAEITIAGKVDTEAPFYQPQPPFIVPTPEA